MYTLLIASLPVFHQSRTVRVMAQPLFPGVTHEWKPDYRVGFRHGWISGEGRVTVWV